MQVLFPCPSSSQEQRIRYNPYMNRAKHTQIFAHRGANKEAVENTRVAFDKALVYAIDGIETDVQLSRDEISVLWHDRFLIRLGLPDKHIDDFDCSQLQAMSKGADILTLRDFLDAYRKRCRLLIEIKNREWEPVTRHEIKVRQTLDMIGATADDTIMASSFNLASLMYAQKIRPGFPLIYNFETEQTLADARRALADHPFLHGLCLPIENLNEDMVNLLREHSKCIAVYTCNSDEEINKALQLKVDILISDVPQKALHIRDA